VISDPRPRADVKSVTGLRCLLQAVR
jgi:hypothetical protein